RRGRITPEQAGLTSYGPRRVPGLRREEVAVLAGVSVPYYTRLERGDMNGVSASVLEALARALQLDDAERAHLFDLARAAQPPRAATRTTATSQISSASSQRRASRSAPAGPRTTSASTTPASNASTTPSSASSASASTGSTSPPITG